MSDSDGRASSNGADSPSPPPPPVPPMPTPLSARDRHTSAGGGTSATAAAGSSPGPASSAISKLIGKYEVSTAATTPMPVRSLSTSSSNTGQASHSATPVHAPSTAERRGSTPLWQQQQQPQQQSPMQPLHLSANSSGNGSSQLHPPPPLPLPSSPESPLGPATPAFPFAAAAAAAASTTPHITVMPPRASSGEETITVLSTSGNGVAAGAAPRRPGPPPLPTMPSPRSPLSPTASRHHRQRTQDDAGVEEVEAYLRAPGQATGPVTPRRLASAAAAAVGTRRAHHTPNNASLDASSISVAHPSPTASPGSTAAARHKLKSFRTLPLNLPSSSVLAAAAAFNQAMQEQAEEEKTNDSVPRRSSGRPMLSILSPSSGPSALISVRSPSPAFSASSASPQPPAATGSSSVVSTSTRAGHAVHGHGHGHGHGSALSPTQFSYWEKRNIWVQREQEEMRAKVHLKKVLRKINQSNMIVADTAAAVPPRVKLRSSWSAGTTNSTTPAAASTASSSAATTTPLTGASGSPKTGPVSPSPSPPAFPLALVNGAAAVAAVRRDNALTSPRPPGLAPAPAPTPLAKVSSPTASSGQAITITELTAAASTLNLTAHLGSTHAVKELTTHLTQMEQAECKFTSAPQIMWALKALTTTGTEEPASATADANGTDAAGRARLPKPSAPAPTSARDIAACKRASIERILSEQNFAPSVVQYIWRHTVAAPPPVPAMPLSHTKQQTTAAAAASPATKAISPPAAAAGKPASAAASTAVPAASPTAGVAAASAAGPSLPPVPLSSPGATSRRQTMPAFPSSSASSGGAAGPGAASSTRNHSGATELDHEWSRRHIPKVKSFSQQGLSMRHRIDAKLREEEEELAEKRRHIVDRMRSMSIWNDASAISEESILSSLGLHRFDLLRFTFELTELHEMAERNIRFDSAAQAMAALKVLYEKRASGTRADLIPPHIMAYLEARRNEIMNSREETASAAAAATAAAAAVAAAPGLMRSPGGSRSVVGAGGAGGGGGAAGAHSIVGASPGPPPTPLSVASSAPAAAPLSSAHHRAISLLEFVEMLSAGNLLDDSASSSSEKRVTPESLSWLLSDVGLDISEVSIDDLIQMQQHPSLVRSFATPKQIVCALQILYTHYDEQEVEEQAQREALPPKVIQYLLQQQRASLMGVGAPSHPGNSVSVGDVSMLIDALSFQSTLIGGGFAGDGRKRTRIQRAKRAKDMRAKIIEYELQSIDEELAFESIEEGEGGAGSAASAKAQPKYQSYELKISDRKVLAARHRRKVPLPSLPLPKLCAALNSLPADSHLLSSEFLPLSTTDLAQLVVEMPLVLSEGDCEIDLLDLELMQAANAAAGGDASKRLQFQTPKQCLMALQLLNVDCVSLAEFEASCARSNFSAPVVSFLQLHSRSMVAQRLLVDAAAHARPAAKCALLEFEIQKAEDLEEMEMEQMDVEDGRAVVEFGAAAGPAAGEGGAAAGPKSSFVSHELGLDDGIGSGEELEYSGRLSIADLSQRLQQSTLLSASSDPSGSSASTLAHLIVSMDLPLATIDQTLLASDLAMMEQQGGLKFKHARHLLTALVMLQEDSLAGEDGEEDFFESLESQHFSPSVTTFLVQLHRSPARADRLALNRSRRNGRKLGTPAAASVMMQSEIAEEGDEAELVEEEVNGVQGGRSIPAAQSLGADSKPLKESAAGGGGGGCGGDSADAALIQQHIRNSSHFKRQQQSEAKTLKEIQPPPQEAESPPPAGCCSKGACAIQ